MVAERTATKATATKRIAVTDIVITAGLPVLFFFAWIFPVTSFRAISRAFARLIPLVFGQSDGALKESIDQRVGARELPVSSGEIARDYFAAHIERKLLMLRMHRPGHWEPTVSLEGQSEIDAALERGKGVVLWDSHFAFAGLVSKIALSNAGYAVSHLSQPSHGFDTATAYGMRFLNPLICSVEERYLKERVKLSLASSTKAMRVLMRRLRENGVVGITVRDNESNTRRYPFMNGTLGIGSGAPFLAAKTGAALLPLFALARKDSSFEVVVGPRIVLMEELSAEEQIARATQDYIELLIPYVLKRPAQWLSWSDR